MTCSRDDTRAALRRELTAAHVSHAKWAREHSLLKTDVSDCLHGKAMSQARENRIRLALRLLPITRSTVQIDSDERVVKKPGYGPKRGYVERKIRVTPAEGEWIDAALKRLGFASFSEFYNHAPYMRRAISTALDAATDTIDEG